MDGCCIEDTATKMVHALVVAVEKTPLAEWYTHLVYYALGVCFVNRWLLY